jgi:phenylalanyl-tRNA synthetase alpha subunit
LKKHYALTNKHEYFAECSEAYFSSDRFRNDYYPFTKSELIEFDPVGVEMCNRLWVELPETMEAVRGAAKVKQ